MFSSSCQVHDSELQDAFVIDVDISEGTGSELTLMTLKKMQQLPCTLGRYVDVAVHKICGCRCVHSFVDKMEYSRAVPP